MPTIKHAFIVQGTIAVHPRYIIASNFASRDLSYVSAECICLKQFGCNNHFLQDGITPLHMACKSSQLDIVKCLLSKGAKSNDIDEVSN